MNERWNHKGVERINRGRNYKGMEKMNVGGKNKDE